MLASHGIGALWYLRSMDRQNSCWIEECKKENGSTGLPACNPSFLVCSSLRLPERNLWLNSTNVISKCNSTSFDFGIFANALTDEIVGATFFDKYFYCLSWGLKNLSSFGNNLKPSAYIGETTFVLFIWIMGFVLYLQLIGNMQTYLQSITARHEKWRRKRRDIEEWMKHRHLPEDLQKRIQRFIQYRWFATEDIDEELILRSYPLDLRRKIQRHLYLPLFSRVWFFSQMDDPFLDIIFERLSSSFSIEGAYIVREGDPVYEMLFIIHGELESSTTNGGRSGFVNSTMLQPGDVCGEELLTWSLVSNANLPSSRRTVEALTNVEAIALRAEDLKFVANQFKRLHGNKLQHIFRYYSHHFRNWGAYFILAAWVRFMKRQQRLTRASALSLKMRNKLLKPADPDFSMNNED